MNSFKTHLFTRFLYGLPRWWSGKESTCQCRRHRRCGFNPGWGRSPGGEGDNPQQYPCLRNPIDRGTWQATVHELGCQELDRTEHACTGACTIPFYRCPFLFPINLIPTHPWIVRADISFFMKPLPTLFLIYLSSRMNHIILEFSLK